MKGTDRAPKPVPMEEFWKVSGSEVIYFPEANQWISNIAEGVTEAFIAR